MMEDVGLRRRGSTGLAADSYLLAWNEEEGEPIGMARAEVRR
jgi:hypothetical protein